MLARRIIAIFAFLLLCAAAAAQSAAESCSSRATAYARSTSAIRESPSHTAASVRSTTRGEKLDIASSQRHGPWCWLQVDDGWIIDSGTALSAQPVSDDEPASTFSAVTTVATGGTCYSGNRAYISGSMNIRASATTASAVTGSAQAGDELTVADSRRGQTWCWLKVNGGWIANTNRVHAQKPSGVVAVSSGAPTAQTPAQQPVSESVDNCCFVDRQCRTDQEWTDGYWAYQHGQCPSQQTQRTRQRHSSHAHIGITEMSPGFITLVNRGFELLETRAPQWYAYTVDAITEVNEHQDSPYSYVYPRTGVAYFNFSPYSDDPYNSDYSVAMAEFLVHEACHVYQHREGRMNLSCEMVYDEFECVDKQLQASLLIDPTRRNILRLRQYLAYHPNPCV